MNQSILQQIMHVFYSRRIDSVWQLLRGTLLLCFFSMLLFACSGEEYIYPVLKTEKGTAMLHFTLGVPQDTDITRGVSDDPKNVNNSWTDWERLVDGRYLYRVTLLLVDAGNKLVGYKDWDNEIKTSTTTTEVSATFADLELGETYTMYALANYSAITADNGGTTGSYNGLTGFPEITSLTVGSDVSSLLNELKSYKLDAGADLVAPKQPQPLTLIQDIILTEDNLEVEGELVRTYARLRIEIANRSSVYDLNVNSLQFGSASSKFGYQTEPLFPVPDSEIPVANGSMNKTATDAMTPFAYTSGNPLVISAMVTGNETAQNAEVAFDAYLYECKNTAGFEYALNLGYNGTKTTEKTVYEITGNGTKSPQSGKYLIGYGSSNYFLTAGSDIEGTEIRTGIAVGTELDVTQYKQHVWDVSVSGSTITVQSEYNDKYINIGSSDVSLGNSSSSLTLSSGKISKVVQGWFGSETTYYIQANNSGGISSTSRTNNGTAFTFYPLKESSVSETESMEAKDYLIPMETLIDGVPHTTSIIRRNDFINVLVTVSYNENTGTMDFHVEDWVGDKGGEIEFD